MALGIGGIPLSVISLVVLCAQNSLLTILLRYSRTHNEGESYSAASAVLAVELLKGLLSIGFAWRSARKGTLQTEHSSYQSIKHPGLYALQNSTATTLVRQVFSPDCWKLSIPAILYVIQNNLQYVAATNLDVPTFQVTYNLKILTTALFSVILLGRRLYSRQWFALALLAVGVGIVQLANATTAHAADDEPGFEGDKLTGLLAVLVACITSGVAGVYFELILKGSRVDLWIRNIQLAFFSLLPALSPVFFPGLTAEGVGFTLWPSLPDEPIFKNFTPSAWAVVLVQVLGGLVTAIVVRHADNILKGFATSIAIVISFLAGVVIFHFQVTGSFVLGSATVVLATWLYNQPVPAPASATPRLHSASDSPLLRNSSPITHSRQHSNEVHGGLSIDVGGSNYSTELDQIRSRQFTGAVPATPDLVIGFDRQITTAPLPPSR